MESADKRLERMGRLIEASMELLAKQHDLFDEMQKLVKGEPTIGVLMREVTDAWDAAWTARYRTKYHWSGVKEMPHVKRLTRGLGAEELKSRLLRFLKDDDAFYVQSRHPFTLFASNVNRYTAEAPEPLTLDAPVIPGCKHTPPCTTDQQHTKRVTADRRAGSERRAEARS